MRRKDLTRPDRILRGALLAAALCLAVPACGRKQEVPAETAAAEEAAGLVGAPPVSR